MTSPMPDEIRTQLRSLIADHRGAGRSGQARKPYACRCGHAYRAGRHESDPGTYAAHLVDVLSSLLTDLERCPDCAGGYDGCDDCDMTGRRGRGQCRTCGGTGRVECPTCDATGLLTTDNAASMR